MLATLAAVECVLRFFAPIHTVGIQSAYQYDQDLGYRLAPGVHRHQLTDHLEEIRTNALGTVNFQERFDGYPALVFAAGDSFTQGTGNPSDASYPFQLDLLLNQDDLGFYRERFGVVNLGLAAFGTEQSLIALKRYARLLGRPRYVLYLGSENDWEDDVLLRSGYRHRHVVSGSPRWGRLAGPLQWVSGFEVAKRGKFALSAMSRARLVEEASPSRRKDGLPVAALVWPSIAQMAALSREWDALLVIGWANPETESYAWLKARATDEHIPFADWAPPVESVRVRMPGLPMANTHSGGHWRPWTNAVIARTYARAMGVWPAAPATASPEPVGAHSR